jgi:TRAP-type C4-dicarboxylate transport system permease small subunit
MRILLALDRAILAAIRWGAIASLLFILGLLSLGVFVRAVPIFSMSGYDEIIELLMAWLTFLGAAALWRQGTLFRVELLELMLPPAGARWTTRIVKLIMLAFALIFTIQGWDFTSGALETVPFLAVSKQGWYAAMPVAGLLMTIYAVIGLLNDQPLGGGAIEPIPQAPQMGHR